MHYIQFFPYFPLLYPVFSIFRKHSFPHRTSFSYFCPDDPLRSHFSLSFFPKNLLKKRPPSNTSHHIGQGAVFIYHILILSPIKKIGKQHGKSRNKRKKHQYQNHAQIERKCCLCNLFYRQMGNCR